ncbi:hypothetical protein RvY_08024 [Ramazzottius varieornatus]|uniref:Small integral membrane protein 13 n=1 Tax=Ramazzottius varieornatus TaxID=947166 RepID=A0A1D1V4A8_RAMVA|nr:hypothetical protein RvY_08024 [Ramazzottius varieornatus]
MAEIGAFEIFGTLLLVLLAVVIVLLFIVIGWFVVWKLILSHFRFFREILGMESPDEEQTSKSKSKSPSRYSSSPSMDSPEIPAHIRRRQQRAEEMSAKITASAKTTK